MGVHADLRKCLHQVDVKQRQQTQKYEPRNGFGPAKVFSSKNGKPLDFCTVQSESSSLDLFRSQRGRRPTPADMDIIHLASPHFCEQSLTCDFFSLIASSFSYYFNLKCVQSKPQLGFDLVTFKKPCVKLIIANEWYVVLVCLYVCVCEFLMLQQ